MTLITCSCRCCRNLCPFPLLHMTYFCFSTLIPISSNFFHFPLSITPLVPHLLPLLSAFFLSFSSFPLPLRGSNHCSPANQKAEESIKHHSGKMSPGSRCYERFSREGRMEKRRNGRREVCCSTKVRQGGDRHGCHVRRRPSLFSLSLSHIHTVVDTNVISLRGDSGPVMRLEDCSVRVISPLTTL